MKVVCCVCKAVIRDGSDEKISHGYCKPCAAEAMYVLRQGQLKRAKRALNLRNLKRRLSDLPNQAQAQTV